MINKSDADNRKERQRDRETERRTETQTYKLDWNPLGFFGTQCGENALQFWTLTLVIVIVIISLVLKILNKN